MLTIYTQEEKEIIEKEMKKEADFFKNVAALNSSLSGCLVLTSLGVNTRINAIRRVGETLCKLCDLKEGKQNDQ